MKKLILFIFLFSMNYGCDFVETKNLIEKRAINSVKELELQDKIVCDEEWKKIIYIVNMKEFGNLLVNGFILENNTEPLPVVGNLVEVLLTISLTSKNAK